MDRYRGAQLIRAGLIGIVLMMLVIAVGLQPDRLVSLATTVRYQALFAELGGLAVGNDVSVSGIKVGTVSGMSLQHGDVLVTFTAKANVPLGSDTTAHIRTKSMLGERILTLESAGGQTMHPMTVIPVSRTSSPYSLNEALSDLTTNVAEGDTQSLNQALDTLSETIDRIAPQLGPTFDGLTRLSQTLNGRNQALRDLLKDAGDVTGILSERSQRVNSLILNANDLVGVLARRQDAIVDLLANTSVVAKQLTGLVHDNEAKLAPTLDRLNSVIGVLEKNRDNLAKGLPLASKFQVTVGESVASGNFYQAYVPNMYQFQMLQPFLDYFWGFRNFDTDPGRGPGVPSPMPRALFPWPLLQDYAGHP
ncbi:MAG TPA: MCE family protein [Mycobacterium sp.]|nr:MCE family protein [Mycobacterium sp.]